MIRLIDQGEYSLVETNGLTKLLLLDNKKTFAWISAIEIIEVVISPYKSHGIDHLLAKGKYRMYEVKNEPAFSAFLHLELLVGNGTWQGYILPLGLPVEEKKRNKIVPTKEIITKAMH